MRTLSARLSKNRTYLIQKYPFYARLLLRLKFALAPCKTAATDLEKVYFDPDFLERIDDEQACFVLLHELLHCVLGHPKRAKGKNTYVYNIAADLVVNSLALEILGKSEMQIDGALVMHKVSDNKEGRMFTAEQLYFQLLSRSENKIPDAGSDIPSGNQKSKEESQSGNVPDSDSSGTSKKKKSPGSFSDSHELWEEVSQDPKSSELQMEWESTLMETVKDRGVQEGCLQRQLPEGLGSKTDWQAVLSEFLCSCRPDYSYERVDVRMPSPFLFPQWMEQAEGASVENIWICIDVSGSVEQYELAAFTGEIQKMFLQFDYMQGWISFFDTKVSRPVSIESIEEIEDLQVTGGGGTDYKPLFASLNDFFPARYPAAIIILTDGWAPFPAQSDALGIPVLWMITDPDRHIPWGIRIDTEIS